MVVILGNKASKVVKGIEIFSISAWKLTILKQIVQIAIENGVSNSQ